MNKLSVVSLLVISNTAFGLTFPISKNSNIVGSLQTAVVQTGESLGDIGRKFDIGVYEMIEANPRLDPWQPGVGTKVTIPSQFVLPVNIKQQGIVINLAEMRLYYFHPKRQLVSTYPIGIGRKGWLTPLGLAKIIDKQRNPTWRPPKSIRIASLAKGKVLPKVVKPGPNNPLGKFALRLSLPGYLIHGTNRPGGIGVRSSSGCIRMFPEDIQALFHQVGIGTKVRIIHEPYKIGTKNNQVYLEAHEPLSDEYYNKSKSKDPFTTAIKAFDLPQSFFSKIKNSGILNQLIGYPKIIK